MAHEPKLTVYNLTIKPYNEKIENSNRWLFRNIIGEANNDTLTDEFIITDIFRKFIAALDTPEMYTDTISKKCMTANQINLADDNVNTNIILHSEECIFEGIIEGGTYGRRRNKTNTRNKTNKTNVDEGDAITEDFYFLIYMPLHSNKITLLIQSYSDDAIDRVMHKFWKNFFCYETIFYQPKISRFVPKSIIEDFKNNATISSLTFSTEIPSETLLEKTIKTTTRNYKVTVSVKPTKDDIPMDEFEDTVDQIQETLFTSSMHLSQFTNKTGMLKDNSTNKSSPFDLGSSFAIKPSILLSKYIVINENASDFERIRKYCFMLLKEIKCEIYPEYAVRVR